MRHQRAPRKLGRTSSHRRALLRNLVTSLFLAPGGRIVTTLEKAKEARRMAEKMITIGKREGIHARRLAARYLFRKSVVKRLFDEIAPRFVARNGGYTRVLHLDPRPGDNADMALLELVGIAEEAHKAEKEKAKEKEAAGKKKGGGGEAEPKDEAAKAKAKEEAAARKAEAKRARDQAKAQRASEKGKAKSQAKTQTKGGQRGG